MFDSDDESDHNESLTFIVNCKRFNYSLSRWCSDVLNSREAMEAAIRTFDVDWCARYGDIQTLMVLLCNVLRDQPDEETAEKVLACLDQGLSASSSAVAG